ncbi:MAG: LuxR C-terminal-related transcriptional regulator [Acidiferrobacterales bacterium]
MTPRQLAALHAVAAAGIYKLAAIRLGCSAQTIKNHISEVNRRLDTASTVQAVAYALERGWIRNVTIDRGTKWYAHKGGLDGGE